MGANGPSSLNGATRPGAHNPASRGLKFDSDDAKLKRTLTRDAGQLASIWLIRRRRPGPWTLPFAPSTCSTIAEVLAAPRGRMPVPQVQAHFRASHSIPRWLRRIAGRMASPGSRLDLVTERHGGRRTGDKSVAGDHGDCAEVREGATTGVRGGHTVLELGSWQHTARKVSEVLESLRSAR